MNKRILSLVSAGVFAFFACGGGSSPSTPNATPAPAAPTPAPCTQTILLQGSNPAPSRILINAPFTTSTTGRLDVILDWTFADSPLGVYVTQGSCNLSEFNARTCNFIIRSEAGPKPRKVSASGVAPGSYQLLFATFGSRDESISTQVILSSSGCPALTSTAAATRMADSGTLRDVQGWR
jgi:hypothetical protein